MTDFEMMRSERAVEVYKVSTKHLGRSLAVPTLFPVSSTPIDKHVVSPVIP
jgi:hypothetical protein